MNTAYKLVWNATLQAWTVASELAKGHKKSSGKSLKAALVLLGAFGAANVQATPSAGALPTGESVASGTATFDRSVANQLTVNQSTSKLITNWNSFDIGSAGTVTFVQPGASSIALNRVTTGSATEIFGHLSANGQIAIVNPNGIVFGAGSQVSAASVIGSVLDISDTNFNNSNYQFSRGAATGSIEAKGTITANGGTVALLAPSITTSGTIQANAGHIGLVNADQVTLSATTPTIDQASTIAGVIKSTGSLIATKVGGLGGRILLQGDKSNASSNIELNTLSTNGQDQLLVSGKNINIKNYTAVFLNSTFSADDNINIAGSLYTASHGALNLIYGADGINSANEGYFIKRNGSIDLNGNGSFSVNAQAYTVIKNLAELQAISDLTGKYALANNIDATDTSSWNAGAGFNPIGLGVGSFTGTFDGLGHTVNNLFINRPTQSSVGLFNALNNGRLQNIGITNANITGMWQVGALVGSNLANNSGKSIVYNAYSSGQIKAYTSGFAPGADVGGLVGGNSANSNGEAIIQNSYSTAAVTGNADSTANYNGIGGLVGSNAAGTDASTARIISSYATGNVTGVANGSNLTVGVGGLVGYNKIFGAGVATIDQSFATGSVSGQSNVGGLVGANTTALAGASATGSVQITNSYANGSVTGTTIGGLAGRNERSAGSSSTAIIRTSYSTGVVTPVGPGNTGGLIGFNIGGVVQNNYWNRESSGRSTAIGGTSGSVTLLNNIGLFNTDMTSLANFSNFNNTSSIDAVGGTSSIWRIYEGNSAPLLRSILTPTIVSANATKTYNGATYTPNQYTTDPTAVLLGTAQYAGTAVGARNVGSYTINVSGLYSNQFGYDISYQTGSLTIDKANLVISSGNVSKTYDGTTAALGSAVATAGTQLFGTDTFSGGTFGFTDKNAGTGKTVTVAGVSVNDGNSGNNYDISYANNTNSTINKASLILSSSNVTKTYDGTTSAAGTAVATGGTQVFAGDSISGGTFAFDTKHAGAGKHVIVSGVTVDDGNSGNNYNVSYADNTASTINQANLVLTTTDVNKTYDGTTDALGTAVATGGTQVFAGDSLTGGTFTYDTKHAGTGKTVSVSAVTVNDGNSGNNYNVSYVDNTNSSIDKASLVISSSDVSKTYDGTTLANGTAVAAAGTVIFAGDSLTGGTFAYDSKHAGTGKTVSVSGVTVDDGNSGNNYNVSYADNTNSSIAKANLVITSTNAHKVYNGTTAASASAVVTSGTELFASDSISGGTFTFDNRNAGTGKSVSVSGVSVSDGNSGNNYNVIYQDNVSSTIDKAMMTIQAVADTKVYDGRLTSSVRPMAIGRVRGDSISGLRQEFSDKNAGTGKTINVVSGFVINDGNGGNNYTVNVVSNHAGVITPKQLILKAVANSKAYDGGITSANKPTVIGLLQGDRVTGLFQQYTDKQIGTNKTLVIKGGYVVDDANGGNNYTVDEQSNQQGVIF